MNRNVLNLAVLSLTIVAGGCASEREREARRTDDTMSTPSSAITREAGREEGAHSFVEIKFNQGSSILTQNSKNSLRALINEALTDGKEVDEIKVLSWADQEYPSKNLNKLTKNQRDLADHRNQAVSKYLKSIKNFDVDTYNMAEQPNTVEKWFNTSDARLKETLVQAGLPTTADHPQTPSKAAHSVILLKLE